MFLTPPQMREGDQHVVIRRDIYCGRVNCRRGECGRPSHTCTQGAWTLLLSGVVLVIIHRVAERTDRVSSLIRTIVGVHP